MKRELIINFEKTIAAKFIKMIQMSQGGTVILSGGKTPALINQYISSSLNETPDLHRKFFNDFTYLLSDERYVSQNHTDSNQKMLRDSLFGNSKVLIGPETNLPFEECVLQYDHAIKPHLNSIFLSLLGMGADGHIASIFPNKFDLNEKKAAVSGGRGPDSHMRISLSAESLKHSGEIWILVNSYKKRKAVEEALSNPYNPNEYPLQLLLNHPNTILMISEEANRRENLDK